MRTDKFLALLSAILVTLVLVCPLTAQTTAQPDNPKVLIDKGLQAFQSYNFDRSSALFRQALRVDNDVKKLSKGQREELVRLLDESAKGRTEYRIAESSLQQGKKAVAMGNYDAAKKDFDRVLAAEKYIPKSWSQEAQVQLGVIANKSKGVPARKTVKVITVLGGDEDADAKAEVDHAEKADKADKVAEAEKTEAKAVKDDKKTVAKADKDDKVVETVEVVEIIDADDADVIELEVDDDVVVVEECEVVEAKAPVAPADPTILDEILAARNVQREQALATFRDGDVKIRTHVANHKFLLARDVLSQVRQDIQRSRRLFEQAELEQLQLQMVELGNFIDSQEQIYQQQQMLSQAREAEQKRIERELQVDKEKADKIESLFVDAVKLRREKKYAAAIDKANEILEIEPNFERAVWFIEDIQDLVIYDEQGQIQKNIDHEARRALTESDKVRISWVDEIQYPKNWEELAKHRDEVIRKLGLTGQGEPASRVTEKLLKSTILENTEMFEGTLQEAFNYFQGEGINVFVRWDVLEFEGISPDDDVKYSALEAFRNINLGVILEMLLSTMGPPEIGINYAIDSNGIIVVSTRDNLLESNLTPRVGRLETRIYNIADLMMYHPTLSSIPEVEPDQESESINQEDLEAKEFEELTDLDELVEYLITLVQTVVAPTTWLDAGGEGSVDVWRHRWLVIYQTPENHDLIANLFESMREVQSVQIALEARFVTVSSNFLEKVGLDLDIIFNSGNAGYDYTGAQQSWGTSGSTSDIIQPRAFSYQGSLPATPSGASVIPNGYSQPYGAAGLVPSPTGSSNNFTPFAMTNGSSSLTPAQDTSLPGNLASSVTEPAFQIAGAFLDDIQVNFLLEATQVDKYSSIVQAPRVVMENGSLGYIAVQTDVPYVEEIEVTVGEQAAGQEPTVEFMGFGTVLAVRAVTRDLKYVNMYVVPQITQPAPDSNLVISVPIVAPGSVGATDYIYPAKRTTRVESVVSVPDGGTLLLGGLKQNGEIEMEAGPPILSKIPVLKRLFSNTSLTKDSFTLMIMVKPKIMVREEIDPAMSKKYNIGAPPVSSFEY